MPIYEYRCSRCDHEFEVWQRMSDPPIKVCPKCHAHKVEKQISLTSFQLKGTGWYATDYGKTGSSGGSRHAKPESAGAESKANGSEKSSDAGKSEKPSGEKGGEKGSEKGSKSAGGVGGATPRLAAAAA